MGLKHGISHCSHTSIAVSKQPTTYIFLYRFISHEHEHVSPVFVYQIEQYQHRQPKWIGCVKRRRQRRRQNNIAPPSPCSKLIYEHTSDDIDIFNVLTLGFIILRVFVRCLVCLSSICLRMCNGILLLLLMLFV